MYTVVMTDSHLLHLHLRQGRRATIAHPHPPASLRRSDAHGNQHPTSLLCVARMHCRVYRG